MRNTKRNNHRNLVLKFVTLATHSFKDSVMITVQSRSDDTTKTIVARIGFEHDLVSAEARYHNDCFVSFLKPTTRDQVGRPQDEALNLAMKEIFSYIESRDDCQFTLEELKNSCKSVSVDNRTIKLRLKLNYGDIITEKLGQLTFVCFLDNYHINNQAWS